jgi:hypothetical protein
MSNDKSKLTLYRPVTYQIKVPGALDTLWVDETSSLSLVIEEQVSGQPISILTGLMDQATLLGLLRRLYGLGLPLISVMRVASVTNDNESEA